MEAFTFLVQIFSALAFLGYGCACLGFGAMKAEFKRFGLEPYRAWVGLLEILGGLGLLVGLYYEPIALIAAGGLTLLMAMGIIVRLRIGDHWIQIVPAAILGGMNFFVALRQLY